MIISTFTFNFLTIFCVCNAATIPPGLLPLLDGRIVGGQSTKIENFPYQISMRYLGNHRCGGSIIGQRVIATAAHCVDNVATPFLIIRAGVTERNQTGIERGVLRYIIHGAYNRRTMENDIAVLYLYRDYHYSPTIQPIELSSIIEEAYPGRSAIVSGWGATREGSSGSNVLQFVEVEVIDEYSCSKAYSGASINITRTMICAGNLSQGGRDACQGDSGGPLIIYDTDNKTKLVGIVSWGYGCARPLYPGVYTRVSALRGWIDESIRVLKTVIG